MAFRDKITTFFGRKAKSKDDMATPREYGSQMDSLSQDQDAEEQSRLHVPSPATEEERRELVQQMHEDFCLVGSVLDRLGDHVQSSLQVMRDMHAAQQRLPEIMDRQLQVADQTAAAAQASGAALHSLTEALQRRDETQEQAVIQLKLLAQEMAAQRQHDKERADLLLMAQRSGRRLMAVVLFLLFILFIGVLALLLAVVLQMGPFRDRVTTSRGEPIDVWSRTEALDAARSSPDPIIRERAAEVSR